MKYAKKKISVRKVVKKTPSTRKYTRKNKTLTKTIKNVINSKTESKFSDYTLQDVPMPILSAPGFDNYIFPVCPTNLNYAGVPLLNINQGTAQGERVGNKIEISKTILRGVLRPNIFYDATKNPNPCPLYACLYIVSLKKHLNDDISTLGSIIDNSFFQTGNTSSGLSGNLIDLTRAINTDHICLHKRKVFKLGAGNYVSAYGAGSANNLYQQYNNNDASIIRTFKISLKMPKSITFNDGAANPTNLRRRYLFIVPYRIDGTAYPNGAVPFYMDFSVEIKYKDL